MKTVKFIAIIFAGVYSVLVVYYFFLQKKVIFYPVKEYVAPPKDLKIEEVYFNTADGEKLHGWYLTSSPEARTVLYSHGNAANLATWPFRMDIFNQQGLNALIYDYRGYGLSSGKIKKEDDLYIDAEAAWNFLIEDKRISQEKIIIWGRSLGGGVAVHLAQNKKINSLILEATPSSFDDLAKIYFWYLPIKFLLRFNLKATDKIKNVNAPVLLVHSRDDEIVPFIFGKKLFDATKEPKTFLQLQGGHNTDIVESYTKYTKGLIDFLQKDTEL